MLLRKSFVKRNINLIFVFVGVFILFIGTYFYLSFKTKIGAFNISFDLIKNVVSEFDVWDLISKNVSEIYTLFIFQLIIFLVVIVFLLIGFGHVFGLYLVEKKNSLIDPLTEIYNRRAILLNFEKEIKRAIRYKNSVSLAILDIDFFKKYNDCNGHVAGDRLLKRFAKILNKSIREFDLVGRIGGEEFLIVFPETPVKEAFKVCERVRKIIEKTAFVGEENLPKKKLTVSIGVAEFKGNKKIKEELLLDIADKCLYNAKKSGRNKVVFK